MFDVSDKIALITGSAGGLGLQMASTLARAGAIIALCDINEERLESAKEQILDLGTGCEAFTCDLGKFDEIQDLVNRVIGRFGRIDILINNAGVSTMLTKPTAYTDEEWRWVMSINRDAYYYCAREVAEHMKEQGGGRIINMASMHAEIELPNTCWPVTAYSTSKGAVREMTQALAVELGPFGINVNAIAPGYIQDTGLTKGVDTSTRYNAVLPLFCPLGRIGRAEDLDGVVLLLASDASAYITGQTIFVDGGWTCL